MRNRYLRLAWAGVLLCVTASTLGAACGESSGKGKPPATSIGVRSSVTPGGAAPSGSEAGAPASSGVASADAGGAAWPTLPEQPFGELGFVPSDCEAVVRVDLAALAARDPDSGRMLDFLLRAQQPAAWRFLGAAGVSPGKELRAIYLVVGPRANVTSSYLIAGVGAFDRPRAVVALTRAGGRAEELAGGAVVFRWPRDAAVAGGAGANLPPEGTRVGDASVGVADGLLLVGTPELVRRALETRAGAGDDVRRSALAHELVALDGAALAWGAARGGAPEGLLAVVAPGLRQAHFSLALAEGGGSVRLRAEFAAPAQAAVFRDAVDALLDEAVRLAGDTPVGELARGIRDSAVLAVTDRVLTAEARVQP